MVIKEVFTPRDINSLLSYLKEYKGKAKLIAGGTDLLPSINKGLVSPSILINITEISDLKILKEQEKDILLGSALTHNEVLESKVCAKIDALVLALGHIGCVQTRNLGTLGGNIASAVPSADSAPALLVYDTVLEIHSRDRGRREVALVDFFTGPRQTILEKDEVILSFRLLGVNERKSSFIKQGRRNALSLAVVNLASSLRLESGICRDVRIAMGAVAPTPLRAWKAEGVLEGVRPNKAVIEEAAVLASEECRPIDDLRASAHYRKELVRVYVRRAIESIIDQYK